MQRLIEAAVGAIHSRMEGAEGERARARERERGRRHTEPKLGYCLPPPRSSPPPRAPPGARAQDRRAWSEPRSECTRPAARSGRMWAPGGRGARAKWPVLLSFCLSRVFLIAGPPHSRGVRGTIVGGEVTRDRRSRGLTLLRSSCGRARRGVGSGGGARGRGKEGGGREGGGEEGEGEEPSPLLLFWIRPSLLPTLGLLDAVKRPTLTVRTCLGHF